MQVLIIINIVAENVTLQHFLSTLYNLFRVSVASVQKDN